MGSAAGSPANQGPAAARSPVPASETTARCGRPTGPLTLFPALAVSASESKPPASQRAWPPAWQQAWPPAWQQASPPAPVPAPCEPRSSPPWTTGLAASASESKPLASQRAELPASRRALPPDSQRAELLAWPRCSSSRRPSCSPGGGRPVVPGPDRRSPWRNPPPRGRRRRTTRSAPGSPVPPMSSTDRHRPELRRFPA